MAKWLSLVRCGTGVAAVCLSVAAQASGSTPAQRLDAVFADYNRSDSPGCAVGVYRDGEILEARGYGMADLEQGIAIGPRTVFDIGSTSKQFTAASIALLAQDGELSLDDDVREYIPELPAYGQTITIRHLLNHSSGLRDYIELMLLAGVDIDDVTDGDEALEIITRQRALNFAPGSDWLYSNSGYFLASVIVERVSGKTLPEFAAERIFVPLGMRHTLYRDDYTLVIPQRASAYAPRPGGGYAIDMSNWQQVGDGAVFTTVEDLLRWDRNFYQPRVGGERLLADLLTAGALDDGETLDYALGLFHGEHRGLPTVSHGGSWGGYRAELLRFPEEHFSVAVLCNLAGTNPSGLARQVAGIYLEERLGPAPEGSGSDRTAADVPESALRGVTGTYRDPEDGTVQVLEVADGALQLQAFGRTLALLPASRTEFFAANLPIELRLRFEGAQPGRFVETLEGEETVFLRVETVEATQAELRASVGHFYSPELDATCEVRLESGALQLVPPGSGEPVELSPLERGSFHGGGMRLRFQDGDGKAGGFLLDLGRVRGLVFERTGGHQDTGEAT